MSLTIEKERKHLILTKSNLGLAKEIPGTRTETETIEKGLDSITTEAERNKIAFKAAERLLKSGIEVKDVLGNLEDQMMSKPDIFDTSVYIRDLRQGNVDILSLSTLVKCGCFKRTLCWRI